MKRKVKRHYNKVKQDFAYKKIKKEIQKATGNLFLFEPTSNIENKIILTRYEQLKNYSNESKVIVFSNLEQIQTFLKKCDQSFDDEQVKFENYYDLIFNNSKMGITISVEQRKYFNPMNKNSFPISPKAIPFIMQVKNEGYVLFYQEWRNDKVLIRKRAFGYIDLAEEIKIAFYEKKLNVGEF